MIKEIEKIEDTIIMEDIITESVFEAKAQENPELVVEKTIKGIRHYINKHYKNTISRLSIKDIFDKNLKSALCEALQAEVGVIPTGTWNEDTFNALQKYEIKPGSKGIIVTLWQCLLVCNGCSLTAIDGIFKIDTTIATKALQQEKKMFAGGIVTPELWREMLK